MALIKCTECGKDVSDKAAACPNCGCPIIREDNAAGVSEAVNANEIRRTKRRKWFLIILSIILLAAIGFCVSWIASAKVRQYNTAVGYYNEGKYAECLNQIAGLNYELVPELESKCNMGMDTERIKEANLLSEQKEYDAALKLLEAVKTQDVSNIVQEVEQEKGMTENADYSFLADLRTGLEKRNALADSNGSSYSELVNTEYRMVSKYKTSKFYDADLGKLAQTYIRALEKQQNHAKLEYSDDSIAWEEAILDRSTVIVKLSDEYMFMSDDASTINIYREYIQEQPARIKALKAIDADLNVQLGSVTAYTKDGHTYTMPYTNNSGYVISWLQFDFFISYKGVRVDEWTSVYENISSGEKITVSYYSNAKNDTFEMYWNFDVSGF